MVNFKRIVCEIAVAVAAVAALAAAAPAGCETERHYDQRQNGTENYRLNIDGVVIAVAPADSLLAAAADIDLADLLDLDELNELQPKPKPPATPAPASSDSAPPAAGDAPSADAPATAAAAPADAAGAPKSAAMHGTSAKANKKKGLKMRLAHLLMPLLKKSRHH